LTYDIKIFVLPSGTHAVISHMPLQQSTKRHCILWQNTFARFSIRLS